MAGREIKLGDLMEVIPSVTEFKLTFYNRKTKERRFEECSRAEAKEYNGKEVFFIHRMSYLSADITLIEGEKENA